MEKIWLKVEGLQLFNFYRGIEPNTAWASIRMGEKSFVVGGYFFSIKKDGRLTQNNAMSRMRFFDIEYFHHGEEKPALILQNFIAKAIQDLYLQGENGEQLKSFLRGQTELTEFPFLKPAEWQGQSLMIPVEFIALRSMNSSLFSNGSVYAHIQLGEHLIFWEQRIFDGKYCHYSVADVIHEQINAIYDERAVKAINDLLSREDIQDHVGDLSKTRNFSGQLFFDKTPDYDEAKIIAKHQKKELPPPQPVLLE